MMDGTAYGLLFYAGIALMGAAACGGAIAWAVQRGAWKRLKNQLDREYGEKRR